MSQRKKQVLASMLIFIFALYYANVTFFYHSHTINGFTISHSHFHSNNHTKAGTHTASELSLISALSDIQSLQATACFAGIGLFFLCLTILRIGTESRAISITSSHSYLRAPPTLMLS